MAATEPMWARWRKAKLHLRWLADFGGKRRRQWREVRGVLRGQARQRSKREAA